jgi:hypothetical protein
MLIPNWPTAVVVCTAIWVIYAVAVTIIHTINPKK